MPKLIRFKAILFAFLGGSVPIALITIALVGDVRVSTQAALFAFGTLWIMLGLYLLHLIIPQWSGWLRVVRQKHAGERITSLTFDDGPDEPWTSQVLDVLKEKDVKATFFVLGAKAKREPAILKRMIDEGHDIGNHTLDHQKVIYRGRRKVAEDIIKTSNIISEQVDSLPKLLRTPHGFKRPGLKGVLNRLGLVLIPWTKSIWDTDGSDSDTLLRRFKRKFSELEILLLHDGIDASLTSKDRNGTLGVLSQIIDEYKRRGYRFMKISEL